VSPARIQSTDTEAATVAIKPLSSSFRDPNGFVFDHEGQFLRAVQPAYEPHYYRLMESGLYQLLVEQKLLIPHEDVTPSFSKAAGGCRIIKPLQVGFVSHPFEWSFSELKDSALTTLRIQAAALEHGMTLKDASAYNIQFVNGAPIHIDTLSFECLPKGDPAPWAAYRQFCSHFLAPLALMCHTDVRLHQLQRVHLDGIPLDLASKLLSPGTWLNPGLLLHVHLHARSQRLMQNREMSAVTRRRGVSLNALRGLTTTLAGTIKKLKRPVAKEFWSNYYDETVLGGEYVPGKKKIIREWLSQAAPRLVWDLGANAGVFSRLASATGSQVVSFDLDPDCVEMNYCENRKQNETKILPLVLDMMNPSSACGWDLAERSSFLERPHPDVALALALVHHLAIGNNLPLDRIAKFFNRFAPTLIIEFVPKDDPNAQKLLRSREDIFPQYDQPHFEEAFGQYYHIEASRQAPGSNRNLYLMRRRVDNP